MTGESYATSAEIAGELGPFPAYPRNREAMLRVIRNHRAAAHDIGSYEAVNVEPVALDAANCPDGGLVRLARAAWDRALELGDLDETLIVTTADHSHTLTMGGYPGRGNPILGVVASGDAEPARAGDGKAYTTLGYINGPGARHPGERPDPADEDTLAPDYLQQAMVPLASETHGGEDVVARASGPGAHLFRGTIEQHTIFYILRQALWGGEQP